MSFFAGHSKKTAWKAFAHHQKLLESLGDGDLDSTTVKSVEKFIFRVYNAANAEGCNEARAAFFFVHFVVLTARLRRRKCPNFTLYGGREHKTTIFTLTRSLRI